MPTRVLTLSSDWPAERLQRVLRPLPEWRPQLTEDVRAATSTRAEQAAADAFPLLTANQYLDYFRTGGRASFDTVRFDRRRILRDLVVGEVLERRGRFVEPLLDAVWATCEESSWVAPAHHTMQGAEPGLPNPDEPIVDLWAGETAATLAWTVRLVGDRLDALSSGVLTRLRSEIRRRVLDPCLRRDDFWWMGISDVGYMGRRGGPRIVNNWNPWICSNWITCAVMVEPDPEARARDIAKALLVFDQYLAQVPPDGSSEEGTAYWSRAGATVFEALELLEAATGGAIDLFGEPVIAEVARFVSRMHLAGPWFVDFGDGSPRPELPAGVIYRFGKRVGDEEVTSLGAALMKKWRRDGPDAVDSLGRLAGTLGVVAEAATSTLPEAPPSFTWLSGNEIMVARDTNAGIAGLTLAARGGSNGGSHVHNDVGNFVVTVDGEPLVVDAGIGTYTASTFGPERSQQWTVRSGYHNVPLVGDEEQGTGWEYRAGDVVCDDRDGRAELVLDIAGAYPATAEIARWDRSLALNRDESVEVTDQWSLRSETAVTLVLLLRDRPSVAGNTLRFSRAEIDFDPPPDRLAAEAVALDDPRLASNWDRGELWRATAIYESETKGGARMTIRRRV